MKYRVEHFGLKDFVCPCCGRGAPAALLVLALDVFVRGWGAGIRILKAAECRRHLEMYGGEKSHMYGTAADIAPADMAFITPFHTLAAAMFGRREGWELRLFPDYVHVSVPLGEELIPWYGGVIYVGFR